ncbi:MAG: S4 domain-containing protein YaaA [Gammaproteobacteria bacterium]|nr:S4 domain-containing protein YaaA [Gammaproteobacteria bacterium]
MKPVQIHTDFILLSQLLKLLDIIQTGGEAKYFLVNNKVLVNGVKEDRRGRKLYKDDVVKIGIDEYVIK